MTYATVQDVVARFGRTLTEGETLQVSEWLEDLSSDIRRRIPSVEILALEPDYARLVTRVIGETIASKLRNPEGLRQRTVSIDDFSETKTIDSSNSAGQLSISDEDWVLLLPATSGEAFSIIPGYFP